MRDVDSPEARGTFTEARAPGRRATPAVAALLLLLSLGCGVYGSPSRVPIGAGPSVRPVSQAPGSPVLADPAAADPDAECEDEER